MEKGILLLAFGKRSYGFLAYNLAVSIRHFNKSIPILLLHDERCLHQLAIEQLSIFDKVVKIPVNYENPALTKINALLLSPFKHTLFIDVDSMATKDIEPLLDKMIESESDFATIVTDTYTLKEGSDVQKLNWAYGTDIYEHYKLDKEAVLPCVNTSLIYFRATEKAGKIIEKILKGFNFPFNDLKLSWGGTMPDELPVSVALVGEKNVSFPEKTMLFGNRMHDETDANILTSHYFLSIYGGKNYTKLRYTTIYDREMAKYYRTKGEEYYFKYTLTVQDKHANRSAQVKHNYVQEKPKAEIHTALIPIRDTKLINSKKLIQSYKGSRGERVDVTNWLNCSFMEYKDKVYFVYRMESKPFCTRMKLGICLLDSDLQPIEETNVLLDLHSDLKGFPKGFHVEDPRLFIFNDELYLSYTDGYQMAQAKINPDTLQAVESFYIDKPVASRTEKNWIFFEDEKKLMCSYSLCPHEVFEMNGNTFKSVAKTEYVADWRWGEIRGGTSPYLVDDTYISFFHSAIDVRYRHHTGRQYFMGCIGFSSTFPYEVKFISKEPILAGELTNESIPRLSNKIFVVFPSGVIRKDDSWLISFGYNDHECRIAELTDKFLETNLKPIYHEKELETIL